MQRMQRFSPRRPSCCRVRRRLASASTRSGAWTMRRCTSTCSPASMASPSCTATRRTWSWTRCMEPTSTCAIPP
eukprot:5490107-Pleurochrysis_carterae.AAC.1